MAPPFIPPAVAPLLVRSTPDQIKYSEPENHTVVEAWAQGFNVGSLVLLIFFTLCNYRRRVLLHKLILLELVLAIWHGLFVFFDDPTYGWLLSSTAILLYISYNVHNIISWMKIKPFLPRWGGKAFIITLLLVQPYWILETFANFQYFNLGGDIFKQSRFYEPLARDPWWIFTTVKLVLVIQQNYEYTFFGLVKHSPRFGIMLLCMFISIVFLITDVAVTARISAQSGINPYWRFSLVFKCASDTIFLDDFKSVLDRIAESAIKRVANLPYSSIGATSKQWTRQRSVAHNEYRPGPTVTISASSHNDQPSSKQHGRYWMGKLTPQREHGSMEFSDSEQYHGHIRADTTIDVVSERGRNRRHTNESTPGSGKTYGSQDNILQSKAADEGQIGRFDWDNLPPRQGDSDDIELEPKEGALQKPLPTRPKDR